VTTRDTEGATMRFTARVGEVLPVTRDARASSWQERACGRFARAVA